MVWNTLFSSSNILSPLPAQGCESAVVPWDEKTYDGIYLSTKLYQSSVREAGQERGTKGLRGDLFIRHALATIV
jgi:hypothetical protein